MGETVSSDRVVEVQWPFCAQCGDVGRPASHLKHLYVCDDCCRAWPKDGDWRHPERLNPRCPVCGEDEAEMGANWQYGESLPWSSHHPKMAFLARCRRCKHLWEIEPLSKPWEKKARDLEEQC